MGYIVNHPGIDFLREIRASQDKVFGRRYALYIIALATEIDGAVLDWLVRYGRVIDSLSGHAIAFITFYNTANERSILSMTQVGGLDTPDSAVRMYKYTPYNNIDFRDDLDNDEDLNEAAKSGFFSRRNFNITMTYESDNIARFLGLNLKELPCLIFLDDPKGKDYHVLPMHMDDRELLSQLREIVGEFYSLSSHKPYFDLLFQWKKQNIAIEDTEYQIHSLKQTILQIERRIPPQKINIIELVRDRNQKDVLAIVEGWFERVYGHDLIPQQKIANVLEKLSDKEVFTQSKVMFRFEASLPYYLDIIEKPEMREIEKTNLVKYYQERLCHFLPEESLPSAQPADFSKDTWRQILKMVLSDENPVANQLKAWLQSIQKEIDNIDLDEVKASIIARYQAEIRNNERLLRLIPKTIDDIKKQLDKQERPKIAPVFSMLRKAERSRSARAYLDKTARTIGNNAETVIKAIELALKSQGIS